ncbi:MAG TPA: dihydrodipicolinate reductase C-terminal domain-containing protein [Gemmatimonadales bacterium]|nr:dihydrodipicolinate reductase C-terminal domain-containing protein [Gemmatimonadales bacterium]
MRIAIIGTGKMGRAVAEVARERGHDIVTTIGGGDNHQGAAITADRLASAEVVVEFTRPDSVVGNLERLIAIGVPVVTGTTGWGDQLERIASLVSARGGSLLHAPNFSTGVALLLRAARLVAVEFAAREEFGAFLVDEHHAAKHDAPSGTALALQRALRAGDDGREFPVTSIRGGHHPGRHRITWDSRFETVHLEHAARDRRVFAEGAVRAAEWLPGRAGVFTYDDVLFGRES